MIGEEVWYLPTYLRDDKGARPTGECSLFIRRFRLIETPKGRQELRVALDVLTFDDDDAMVAAIEANGWQELLAEADGDVLYVPDAVVVEGVKVVRDFARIRVENSHSRGGE